MPPHAPSRATARALPLLRSPPLLLLPLALPPAAAAPAARGALGRRLALTKDPYIAARYAAQSGGEVLAVRADELRAAHSRADAPAIEAELAQYAATAEERTLGRAGSVDFSAGAGRKALQQMGSERAATFARADGERGGSAT